MKKKIKKTLMGRRNVRRKATDGTARTKLFFAVLKSFLAGTGSAILTLCILALVFSKTGLPLDWISPAACSAAVVGTFISGLVLSCGVSRYRLLAGVGCGAFYCLCAVSASLLTSQMPVANKSNLSLLAVLMLGAVSGSAAGALHKDNGSFAGVH